MNRFNLALRMLWRDSRSNELTLLILALIIAVTSSTAIVMFANRLQRTMTLQAAEFLAADLVVSTPAPIPSDWLQKATQLKLSQAQTVEFSSVLMEHDELLLASIKAVSAAYPLRGFLKTSKADYKNENTVHQGPKPGTAWVEKRILSALKLKLGDSLVVGELPLKITDILTYEPDKRGDFYSFSPRVMINDQDLAATKIIQPGSHVHYFFAFAGADKDLLEFNRWVKPKLNPSERLMDVHADRPELGSALERAERYLGLSSIVVMLIAGVAIAMATRRYTERHFNATAILRCLGLRQADILWLYSCQFIFLGVVASTVGSLLGFGVQEMLFSLLKNLLPQQVAYPDIASALFGFILGFLLLLGFALVPLLRLKKVSPLRVLRRELEPLPVSGFLSYGLALVIIALLIGHYTQDIKMTAIIIGVGVLVLLLLGFLVYGLLIATRKLLPSMSLGWRLGVQGLLRKPWVTVTQVLAFTITLLAMILSFTVRNDLISNWQKSIPANAPNHFALNIFPEQQANFAQTLHQLHINSSQFYPVVRGRLVAINNTPVQKVVSKDSQGENATHRELSLTFTNTLPEDNKLVQGQWWTEKQTGLVSVEEKLAQSLKIKLGDSLTFTVGSEQVKATVASIRSLQWNTMKPNFYMVFSEGTLNAFPRTVITSFYLANNQKDQLNTLLKKFPSTTILEVDLILGQIQTIVAQLTQAINYLLYFALMAGFTVLFASIYASLDDRIYEGALMRTLGASRRLLQTSHVIEFAVLGLISGVLAIIASEAILYALYTELLHIDYYPGYILWLIIPLLSTVLVSFAGFWGLKAVVNKSPLQVLREL